MAAKFEGRIDHTEDSVQSLFVTQYNTYSFGRVLVTSLAGAALAAVGLLAPLPMWGGGMLLLTGCMIFAGRSFPAIIRAVRAIDARGGALPSSVCLFYADSMELKEGGVQKKLGYDQLDRLVRDRKYLYLFLGPGAVIMVDRKKINPGTSDDLMQLVEKCSGKKWEAPFSLLTMNLHDLLRIWDRKKAEERKEK